MPVLRFYEDFANENITMSSVFIIRPASRRMKKIGVYINLISFKYEEIYVFAGFCRFCNVR